MQGKTYTLCADDGGSEEYYEDVRKLLSEVLDKAPDEKKLLTSIRQMSTKRILRGFSINPAYKDIQKAVLSAISARLSPYTTNVAPHLKGLTIAERFDSIISTKEYQYHLYMLEIELTNRMYAEVFKKSTYRFALIAHCLRDFRPDCRAEPGEVEAICKSCTKECYIHLAGVLMKKYGIDPYISVEMDQEKLFRKLKSDHQSIGALGIACIPELVRGMRLCISLGIPAVGIPLDANRCSRWMDKARESTFSLKELESLLS
ncbi:MAG TPA: DUF116 domain-containing protein [Nitrospirae bacterium]|nr:DUF116 domain-containing protein [Nitrospirota bacterium]